MLYKDLPPEILEIALLRQKEAGNPENLEIDLSIIAPAGGFSWAETPEDYIWKNVDDGNFEPFYEMYPERRPSQTAAQEKTDRLTVVERELIGRPMTYAECREPKTKFAKEDSEAYKTGFDLPKEIQSLVSERFFKNNGFNIPKNCLYPALADFEGTEFWTKIALGDFTEFYKRYPKEDNSQTVAQEAPKSLTPTGKDGFPRKMQVRNSDKNFWRIVTVVAIYNGKAHGVAAIEDKDFESGHQYLMDQWNQWREIEDVKEMTQYQIEEALGYKIKIVNS